MGDELQLEPLLAAAVFCGARVSGLMVFCPFLGNAAVPTQAKAALTLLVTAVLFPLRAPLELHFGPWQWAAIALGELVTGMALGLVANFMTEAAIMAGQILGMQMGYSLATLFDPQSQADTPVLGTLHNLAALLIFLSFNVHHWLLRAVANSFTYLPAGQTLSNFACVNALLHAAGGIFLAAAQIAAPALAATLVTDVVLGFLGKASPQLPVLFVGLAVKNLLGLTVLLAVVARWPGNFSARFAQSVAMGERLLHLAQGAH
jgi:flagellar biosynthetic protein FliR